jgi:hypothetical protein
LFPMCDGAPWTDERAAGPNGRFKLQFLEACWRINQAYDRLVALRKSPGFASTNPRERRLLRQIETAIVARERIEDRHAARGIVASLVYREGFTVDVRFCDVHTARERGSVSITSSSSVRLNIALPTGLRARACKS